MRLPLEQADFFYYPEFLSKVQSNELFDHFFSQNEAFWEKRSIKIFGKTYQSPRLERFCVMDESLTYSYSGQKLTSFPFDDILLEINSSLKGLGYSFNACLINYYRDGRDSNGWHADNEKELGKDPIIASISLGATRKFKLQSKDKQEKFDINLESGSLLIMGKKSQLMYKHQLPKMINLDEPRINLTFRQILE